MLSDLIHSAKENLLSIYLERCGQRLTCRLLTVL